MKTDEYRALMKVIDAKIAEAIERDHGRDSLNETIWLNQVENEFLDKFGEEPR